MLIESDRLRLRPLAPADLERSRRWVNDPVVARGVLRVLPVTVLEQRRWYRALVTDPHRVCFAIDHKAGRRHLGNSGLRDIDWRNRHAEFWIYIGAAEYRGRGYGTEATALTVRHGFDELNLHKIYLHVAEGNAAAVAAYQRAGFRVEGRFRDHVWQTGRWWSVLRMAVIAPGRSAGRRA